LIKLNKLPFFGREDELRLFWRFYKKKGAGLTHLRGRRRIGKTTLLKEIEKQVPHCFYFAGVLQASDKATLKRFAKNWDTFTKQSHLSRIKSSFLDWEIIFNSITSYVKDQSSQLLVIFDEVQWIAIRNSEFLGTLKNTWPNWEKLPIKVILSGSSNKFFKENTEGQETTLMSLRTSAEITVKPFTLSEVKEYYFSNWSEEEVALVYMIAGGIPYYLQQIPQSKNFIRAINESFFVEDTIFLEEAATILNLEFSQTTRNNVFRVLASLGQDGTTQVNIIKKTGLPYKTAYYVLTRLVEYGLVFEKNSFDRNNKANRSGTKYYMKDFYLNFYFQVLEPLAGKIKLNKNGLLFPCECLHSNAGYYIPDFSGKAFEQLICTILNNKTSLSPAIFKKLCITDLNYEVGTYWKEKQTQIDIVIIGKSDREIRLIECKWVNHSKISINDYIKEIEEKSFIPPKGFGVSRYLVVSANLDHIKYSERKSQVGLIGISDLFEKPT
jgi:AAA+ ATPase superfamily predicted ATPase